MKEQRGVYLNCSLHEALNRTPESMMDGDENQENTHNKDISKFRTFCSNVQTNSLVGIRQLNFLLQDCETYTSCHEDKCNLYY